MHITTHTSNAIVVFSKKRLGARATQHVRHQRNRIFEDQEEKNYLNSSVEKITHRNRTHFKTINTPHKIWSITTSLLYALTNPRISSNRNAQKNIYIFSLRKTIYFQIWYHQWHRGCITLCVFFPRKILNILFSCLTLDILLRRRSTYVVCFEKNSDCMKRLRDDYKEICAGC